MCLGVVLPWLLDLCIMCRMWIDKGAILGLWAGCEATDECQVQIQPNIFFMQLVQGLVELAFW